MKTWQGLQAEDFSEIEVGDHVIGADGIEREVTYVGRNTVSQVPVERVRPTLGQVQEMTASLH